MNYYPIKIYDSEPVAYYRLNGGNAEEVVDFAGNNNLIANNISFSESGLIDNDKDEGVLFDGTAYAYSQDVPNVLFPKLDQTLEAWIYASSAQDMTILSYNVDSSNSYVLRFKSDRRIQVMWQVGGAYYKGQTPATSLDLDTPYHIACTLSAAGLVEIYINGVAQSLTSPGDLSGLEGSYIIGGLSLASELFEGQLDEVAVYDYQMAGSVVQSHYDAAFLSDADMDFEVPTISYPAGGEEIKDRNIEITWNLPKYVHDLNMPMSYELFYTEDFKSYTNTDWVQIADVPTNVESFNWRVPFSVKSDKCRVAIRGRDYRGFVSPMSYSANNFSIVSRQIKPPSVISPESGSSYRMFVPILFDVSGIQSSQSQRAYYDVYYSSPSNNIDWKSINKKLPVSNEPYMWDVRDLPAGDDYSLRISLADNNGNTSLTVFVRDINISPSLINYFYIDSKPPKGSITIDDNLGFASSSDVSVRLDAFDATTEVSTVQLRETKINEDGSQEVVKEGSQEEMSNIKNWILSSGDGIKYIEAIFRDAAGNQFEAENVEAFFRRYTSNDNDMITAMLGDNRTDEFALWTAFFDGNTDARLFKNRRLSTTLDGAATYMAIYNSLLYIGIRDSEGYGILQTYNGETVSTLHSFTEEDSAISYMSEYNGKLYIAQENGYLYSFDGTSVSAVAIFPNRINSMYSDGVVLFIFLDHESFVRVYDGSSFSTSEIVNASQQI